MVIALLYPQHAFCHAAKWLRSPKWFDYRLSFAICFLLIYQHKRYKVKWLFTSSHLRLMNGGNNAVSTNIRVVVWRIVVIRSDECRVCFVKESAVGAEQLVCIFKITKHALGRRHMARISLPECKNRYLLQFNLNQTFALWFPKFICYLLSILTFLFKPDCIIASGL